ncbi:TetR/AcrR family transcriptional regulator [Sphingomonas ginkgonis]|uniref:TetR/AcrR family transcriptional regulator n=1 Tax=Sphingomonas ginkgonis TaxID=2315330 RepID=UPI00163B302C|nr:TetR/AcrR family transcriptional regulator [Sphingomonas ginkgonis]
MKVDLAAPSREPLQGRSRASFERMVDAAAKLLVERGNDEFTLADVSRAGKVSIGSIYCRFDSKDDLIRAVQVRALADIDSDQASGIAQAVSEAGSLVDLVGRLVESIAEVLRKHSAILRPFMLRATTDAIVAGVGKKSYAVTEQQFHEALLARRDEIRHPDPERAINSLFRIVYAAVARYLGFGSSTDAAWEGDWRVLKEDLAAMSSAFLRHPPRD